MSNICWIDTHCKQAETKEVTDWEEDCNRWIGRTLTGYYAHWCFDWDFLPVDETSSEMDCCGCYDLYLDDYKRGWISLDFEPWYWGA